MVKIRLKRMGANKKPFYRVVVADSRAPRDGKFIEEIGYYNPMTEPADIKIDEEKAQKWLGTGAQPTDTVKKLFQKSGILQKAVKPMGELVSAIAKSLVENPEAVEVSEEQSNGTTVVQLKVAPDDMGKVIGKQGRIAKAIRSVVKAAAAKEDKKVVVEIMQQHKNKTQVNLFLSAFFIIPQYASKAANDRFTVSGDGEKVASKD